MMFEVFIALKIVVFGS